MTEINLTRKEEKDLLLKALFGSPFFNIFASVLATFIVGTVFFKYGGGVPINVTSSTTEQVSAFRVSGEGKVVVGPDEARVRLGVRKTGSEVAQLQEEASEAIASLVAGLAELGIEKEEVRTVDYRIRPNYENFGPEGRVNGHLLSAELEVRVKELGKTSQVVDLAGRLGLEQVGGVSFGLSDELEAESRREAREMAVEDAKQQAEELAKLAGMRLGKIVNVEESVGGWEPWLMKAEVATQRSGQESREAVSTPIEPGSSEVSVTVVLSYETH